MFVNVSVSGFQPDRVSSIAVTRALPGAELSQAFSLLFSQIPWQGLGHPKP